MAEPVLLTRTEKSAPTPQDDEASYRSAPHNLEAEQALLGSILVNNGVLGNLSEGLEPAHFYVPLHQRIYEAIQRFHDKGMIADPISLRHFFHDDDEISGNADSYLARLAAKSVMVINPRDYSELIIDLALKRQLIEIGGTMISDAYAPEEGTFAREQIESAEQQLFDLATTGDFKSGFISFRAASTAAMQRAEYAYKQKGSVIGVPTGLADLDNLLGGLQDSDLLILAGRPSMGKTALATVMAYNAALRFLAEYEHARMEAGQGAPSEKPRSVGFFSLEMSAEQLANRILSARTEINSHKILRGDLSNEEFSRLIEADHELSELPFFIDDTPALTISALRTRARRLKRTQNLGLLVVDYLQLVRPSFANAQGNRVTEISEITQGLKSIAKELNVPVVALSQLSRAVEQREDKRPLLSDLRESGSIEQDADVVMFVFREEYYLERKKPAEPGTAEYESWELKEKYERCHRKADVIVAKQRHGPIGTATLMFFSEYAYFCDAAEEDHLPQQYQ